MNENTYTSPWTLVILQLSLSNSTFKPFNRIWYDHKHLMQHVASAHGNDKEPIFGKKLNAFDYDINGVCKGGVWGSS